MAGKGRSGRGGVCWSGGTRSRAAELFSTKKTCPQERLRSLFNGLCKLLWKDWNAGCFSDSACFVFQAAFVKFRSSRSTSFGVRYPRVE